jgi:hypothetical protein
MSSPETIPDLYRDFQPYGWMIHTITPVHIATRRAMFQTYTRNASDAPELYGPLQFEEGPASFVGKGTVLLDLNLPDGKTTRLELKNVYHAPDHRASSLSLSALQRDIGVPLTIQYNRSGTMDVKMDDALLARGRPIGKDPEDAAGSSGLPRLDAHVVRREGTEEHYVIGCGKDAETGHERCCHIVPLSAR